jgi:myo-inositol-1(or 4)-monophosphatase
MHDHMIDCAAVELIIRQAGDLLLSYRFKQLPRTEKKDAGFVTEADRATEQFLIKNLSRLAPEIGFFAEETGKTNGGNDYCWVIDPLDGTTNFSYGVPHFCISVALTHRDMPVIGFVYQPLLNELFFAQKGKGAFLNGKPIAVSKTKSLEDSFLLFCTPYGKNDEAKKLFKSTLELSQQAYSLRLLGAMALDQCYVACGRFDGIFTQELAWWDIAAGMLIIQEAGGIVSDFKGNGVGPDFRTYVAGGREVQRLLVDRLT